jgi:Protein of unknown function (DUF3800)
MAISDDSTWLASAAPGAVRWLVSCDESGLHGAQYYAFGSLWMGWQRRGEFSATIQALRNKHGYPYEFKWKKTNSVRFQKFFFDLVDYFFREPALAFHCLVVRKAMVDKAMHNGSLDLARRKHFNMLLTAKIRAFRMAQKERQHTFRIWVDPIASSYPKADEAVKVIANNVLRAAGGDVSAVDSVIVKDSAQTPSIQLCDLLLGAVADGWQGDATSIGKKSLQKYIAKHIGWPDLHADTRPTERKFNVWYFHDTRRTTREPQTRDVELIYPLPPRRRYK